MKKVNWYKKRYRGGNLFMSTCCSSSYHCPVEATLDLIGGKYKSLILWHLIGKTLRFSEIRALIPQATPKMLTQQLRLLEEDGLVNRKVYFVNFILIQ